MQKWINLSTDNGFENHFRIHCLCFGLSTFPFIFSRLVGLTKSIIFPSLYIYYIAHYIYAYRQKSFYI